jgi:hypothetical protein
MEGLLNSIKSMFVKEDGSIKWASILAPIALGVGGYFLAPELPVAFLATNPLVTAAMGAGVGLMGSQLLGGLMGGGDSAPAPSPAAGASAAVQPQRGQVQEVGGAPFPTRHAAVKPNVGRQ